MFKKKTLLLWLVISMIFILIGERIKTSSTKIIAHRGASGYQVEHTFPAYDLAKNYTRYLEQDIVMSKDYTLYVSHDNTPYRLTKKEKRKFSQLSNDEINHLKLLGTNDKFHTLDSVMNRYGKEVTYVIELKENQDILIQKFIQEVKKKDMEKNIIVQSFNYQSLQKVKEVFPMMPTLFLVHNKKEIYKGLRKNYIDIIGIPNNIFNFSTVREIKNNHKQCAVWTLNKKSEVFKAKMYHVDYIFTNYPDF